MDERERRRQARENRDAVKFLLIVLPAVAVGILAVVKVVLAQ